jgi:type III secretion protein Q
MSPNGYEEYDEQGVDQQEGMLDDVPIRLAVEIGERAMSVNQLSHLRVGQTIELNRNPSDLVNLRAGGDLVAQGELVNIEGQLGVRILKFLR